MRDHRLMEVLDESGRCVLIYYTHTRTQTHTHTLKSLPPPPSCGKTHYKHKQCDRLRETINNAICVVLVFHLDNKKQHRSSATRTKGDCRPSDPKWRPGAGGLKVT